MSWKKPPELKALHGTDQPCRDQKATTSTGDNLPSSIPVPSFLNPPGKRKWRELVKLLRERKLLDRVDLGALELCCIAYDEVISCQTAIQQAGGIESYTAKKTSQQTPLLTAKKSAMETYKKYMTEFGLSPASRAKLGIEDEPEESEFERYLREKRKNA